MTGRSRLIEAKLRESLDFFNDARSFSLRRDPRRTSYQLASEIDAALATPTWWKRQWLQIKSAAIATVCGLSVFVLLLAVLPGGSVPQ